MIRTKFDIRRAVAITLGAPVVLVAIVASVTHPLDTADRIAAVVTTAAQTVTTAAAASEPAAHRGSPFGAGGGAVCGTDAQCAAYSESIGEAPSDYAATAAQETAGDVEVQSPSEVTDGGAEDGVCLTFTGETVVHACVPSVSPDGGFAEYIGEDSSATYSDGWEFDAETARFTRVLRSA